MESEGRGSSGPTPVGSESRMEPRTDATGRSSRHEGSSRGQLRQYEEQLRILIPGASGLPRIDLIHSAIDYISDLEEALQARVRKLGSSPSRPPLTVLSSGHNAEQQRPADPEPRLPLSTLQTPPVVNTTRTLQETSLNDNLNNSQVPSFSGFAEMFLRRNVPNNVLAPPRSRHVSAVGVGASSGNLPNSWTNTNLAAGSSMTSTSHMLHSDSGNSNVAGNSKNTQSAMTSTNFMKRSNSYADDEHRVRGGVHSVSNSKAVSLLASNDELFRVKTSSTKYRKVIPEGSEPNHLRVFDTSISDPGIKVVEKCKKSEYPKDSSRKIHGPGSISETADLKSAASTSKGYSYTFLRVVESGKKILHTSCNLVDNIDIPKQIQFTDSNANKTSGNFYDAKHAVQTKPTLACIKDTKQCGSACNCEGEEKTTIGLEERCRISITAQRRPPTVTATRGPDASSANTSAAERIELAANNEAGCAASTRGPSKLACNNIMVSHMIITNSKMNYNCPDINEFAINGTSDRPPTEEISTMAVTRGTIPATLTREVRTPTSPGMGITTVIPVSPSAEMYTTPTDSIDDNKTDRHADNGNVSHHYSRNGRSTSDIVGRNGKNIGQVDSRSCNNSTSVSAIDCKNGNNNSQVTHRAATPARDTSTEGEQLQH